MTIVLTATKKAELEFLHKKEKNRRVADRYKAILLHSEGWEEDQIATALRIHPTTVRQHLEEYEESEKVHLDYKGSKSDLDEKSTQELVAHLEEKTYVSIKEIRQYVLETFGVSYSHQGMYNWLKRNNFSFKKPKPIPAKADPEQQKGFIDHYEKLVKETAPEEPILFVDAVHPTMATKVTYGWIRKGKDKPIETTASRTRINIVGALNLEKMRLTHQVCETINAEQMILFLDTIKNEYPNAPRIHLILDQAGYHKSKEFMEEAERKGIKLHSLPPYSPNLNPIERLWKVMNEKVRNNVFFKSKEVFTSKIYHFLKTTFHETSCSLIDRINDNFQILVPKRVSC